MRKVVLCVLLALTASIFVAPVFAASHEGEDHEFTVKGEVRARLDVLENFTDADDSSEDNFEAVPYRVNLGALGEFTDNVYGYVEFQAIGAFGDTSPVRGGQDPHDQLISTSQTEVDLYEGWLTMKEIGGGKIWATLGRQEHTQGNELHLGDNDFYNGISFDGLRGGWDLSERFDVGAYYYWITERDGLFPGPVGGADDGNLYGADVRYDFNPDTGNELEVYLIDYTDHLEVGAFPGADISLWTYGARWGRDVNPDGGLDWSIELAGQSGTFAEDTAGEADAKGYLSEGWAGWMFGHGGRVQVGYLWASGGSTDDDPDEIGGWIPLYGDIHENNRLGDLDLFAGSITVPGSGASPSCPANAGGFPICGMTNVQNLNARYEYLGEKNYFMAAFHDFTLVEEVGTEDSVGQEIDLKYRYSYSKNLAWEAGYAHLLAGDLLGSDADDITRFWLQGRLTW